MGTDRSHDPKEILGAMHQSATSEVLRLLDGFYFNIEDGLFELAYRTEEEGQRRRCFDLMRELRFRKSTLIRHFAKTMGQYKERWFSALQPTPPSPGEGVPQDLEALIFKMAEKSSSHFSGVLRTICVRIANAFDAACIEPQHMPIGPHHIAKAFVVSCRTLKLDHASIDIVQELFSRFVLDRLGSVYGECNARLENAGYHHELLLDTGAEGNASA